MKKIEKVNIVGMGALGLLFGDIIAANIGSDKVAFVMDEARFERHKDDEYTINGQAKKFNVVKACDAEECDLVIVAVKSTGLEEALDVMKTSVGRDTMIISVLNGISSEKIIGERYGMERILYTVALGMDAMFIGGSLNYTSPGRLCTGIAAEGDKEKLEILTEFFDRACVPYSVEDDIIRRMWSKYMLNVGANQTCMVYGAKYGQLLVPGSAEYMTMVGAMREVILVAAAEGITLGEEDIKVYNDITRSLNPEGTASMGQDRINKKPSEVEFFAGTVIALAEKHGIEVPANRFLYKKVYEIEAQY